MTPFFNFYFLAHVFTLQYTLRIVTVRIHWQQYSIQLQLPLRLPRVPECGVHAWVRNSCCPWLSTICDVSLGLTVWSHLNFRETLRESVRKLQDFKTDSRAFGVLDSTVNCCSLKELLWIPVSFPTTSCSVIIPTTQIYPTGRFPWTDFEDIYQTSTVCLPFNKDSPPWVVEAQHGHCSHSYLSVQTATEHKHA